MWGEYILLISIFFSVPCSSAEKQKSKPQYVSKINQAQIPEYSVYSLGYYLCSSIRPYPINMTDPGQMSTPPLHGLSRLHFYVNMNVLLAVLYCVLSQCIQNCQRISTHALNTRLMIMRGVTGINKPGNTGPSDSCKDILVLKDYKCYDSLMVTD